MKPLPANHILHKLLQERILILDGSMGALMFPVVGEIRHRGIHCVGLSDRAASIAAQVAGSVRWCARSKGTMS